MFKGFANVWTPVCMSTELRPNRPLSVQVAGIKIVLFRGADGSPVALLDRCPHRGVALSLGKVQHGCIECPFHGWRFDKNGDAVHVPWNPDAKTAKLRGVSLAARELAGQIWIYTAPDTTPTEEPAVAEELLSAQVHISGGALNWNCHWTRAMENMLDWPHLPFIHRKTIGRGMMKRPDSRMDIHLEDRPWGQHSTISIDGEKQQGALDLRWPNRMNVYISPPGKLLVMQVACVPIDDLRTRMILTTARSFLRFRILDPIFHRMNLRIAGEDKAVVESSFPAETPPAGDERSVRTDEMTLHFRKRYLSELRDSGGKQPTTRPMGRHNLPVLDPPSD